MKAARRRTGRAILLLAAMGVGALLVLYAVDPAASSLYPRCPLHALTGLLCPLCGGLRAMHHLLHGDAQTAWALNPFVFFALPTGFLLMALPSLPQGLRSGLLWAMALLLLIVFLWRNGFLPGA